MRKLVIIESPYAGDIITHTEYVRACMRDSIKRNEAPFASHILYTGVLDDTIKEERATGIYCGFLWRRKAKLTVVYDDFGITKGMNEGIKDAKSIDQPIEYRQLGPRWYIK